MTKKLVMITVLVALAVPAAALANTVAKNVGNARLSVSSPHHVGNAWVGSASLKAPSAEALQLQVCIQSNGRTVKASCHYVHSSHASLLAATTHKTSASAVRTWAWAYVGASYVGGHTTTAVS